MKSVVLFLANGFEEVEALTVVDTLRRANIKCDMCSIGNMKVMGAHGIAVDADLIMEQLNSESYDCLVLPGGMPGTINLKEDLRIINLVKKFNESNKIIAAICAAPIILNEADIIKSKKITSYPGVKEQLVGCEYKEDIVVEDGNLITSRGPATAMEFSFRLVERLVGKETADKLREGMLYNLL